jgi:hypothetical protein
MNRLVTEVSRLTQLAVMSYVIIAILFSNSAMAVVRYEYVSGGISGGPLTFSIYWEKGPNDNACPNSNCNTIKPVVATTPYRLINLTRYPSEIAITVPGNFAHQPGLTWGAVVDRVWAASGSGPTTHTASIPSTWQSGDNVCVAGVQAWPQPETCSTSFLPSAPVTCTISTPGIILAHGDLAPTNANGSQTDGFATLQCTGNATVNVRAIDSPGNPTSTVPVRADSSIMSHLTVDGVDGATGVSKYVTANQPVTYTLKSTLATSQPSAGALLGNALLVVDVQ